MTPEIRHRTIALNGIEMHVAEAGMGPLVVMCHGWPELSRSWVDPGHKTGTKSTKASESQEAMTETTAG